MFTDEERLGFYGRTGSDEPLNALRASACKISAIRSQAVFDPKAETDQTRRNPKHLFLIFGKR